LKATKEHLQNLTANADTPMQLLAKAQRLESDPYRLWKIIQDVFGNSFFKEVFHQ
jgi:hypothetical protein